KEQGDRYDDYKGWNNRICRGIRPRNTRRLPAFSECRQSITGHKRKGGPTAHTESLDLHEQIWVWFPHGWISSSDEGDLDSWVLRLIVGLERLISSMSLSIRAREFQIPHSQFQIVSERRQARAARAARTPGAPDGGNRRTRRGCPCDRC